MEDFLVFVGDQLVEGGGPFAGVGVEGNGGGMQTGEAGGGEDGTGGLARQAERRNEGHKESGQCENCEEQEGINDDSKRRHVNSTAGGGESSIFFDGTGSIWVIFPNSFLERGARVHYLWLDAECYVDGAEPVVAGG